MASQITSVTAKVNIFGTETDITGFTYHSDTGYWVKQVTAPERSSYLNNTGHFYNMTVTATDQASNSTTVTVNDYSTLKLYVKERTEPIVQITGGITAGATTSNARPQIAFGVRDTNSGVPLSGCYARIDSGSQISITLNRTDDTKATGTFTPPSALSDGEHTIVIYANDNDGNEGSCSVTFTVLTSAPSLTISSPAADTTITNDPTVVVSGSTNTDTGNTVTIRLDDVSQGDVELDSNGNFSKSITIPTDGTHTIIVTSTNAAGISTESSRTVILDTVAPEFESVLITPNPVDASGSYIIKVKVQ